MKNSICRIKNNIQKNQDTYIWGILAGIVIAAVFLLFRVDLDSKVLRFTSHQSNRDEIQIVHDFTTGMEIRQTFSCYEDFDFITLSFSDHDQRLTGKILLEVFDSEQDKLIISEEKDTTGIYYNVPINISFESIGGGKAGKEYEVVLTAIDTEETALGVFGYETEEEQASINGNRSEYHLSIGMHSYTNLYMRLAMLIIGIGSVSLLALILLVFRYKIKEEHIFLVIAIPFAICMLLMWPGNGVYDEARHQNTVYHYSNVLLGCAQQDTMTQIQMRKCDVDEREIYGEINYSVNAQAQDYWYHVDKMWEKPEDNTMVLVDISKSPVVTDGSCLQYIPGILGMTLGRVLHLNYFGIMTLCRAMIMGFYLVMCYYAIKKIPVLKMLAVFWAALPMNLYQASGVSYDSFTFAVGIVVFAYIVKLWYEGLTKKDWIAYAIAVFLLGQCKGGVYLTLILLMAFIPRDKFNGRKWMKSVGILMIAGISMISSFLPTIMSWFVRPIVAQRVSQEVTESAADIAPQVSVVINSGGMVAEKLHPLYILENPISFLKMFINTMLMNLDVYLGQMLGYRTAWSNATIAMVIVLPFLILLIASVINRETEHFVLAPLARLGIAAILLVELVGLQAIFLVETPTYSDVIIGFQGRYFMLFIPCILLLFRNEGLVFKGRKEYLYPCFGMAQLLYLYFFVEMFMCA